MRIIKGPTVTQVRIFPQDTIPYTDLAIKSNFDRFKEKFSFSRVEMPPLLHEPGVLKVINLSGGNINIDNEPFLIKSLNFEDRKIILVIEASSDKADRTFDAIEEELKSIDRYANFSVSNYLIKTEGTECIIYLDIDYHRFLSRQFLSFIKKDIAKYSKQPLRSVSLKNFSFEISFKPNKSLEDMHISIVPKLLTIEPRFATREEDRIFYTRSPCDSGSHLKLLAELEVLLQKSK